MRAADIDRFWTKVSRAGPDECWLWMAATLKQRGGYGIMNVGGVARYAHRLSYEIANGAIPNASLICHTCNTPACVNPAHLYAGSHITNGRDARANGRIGRWDRRGERNPAAKLTEAQVMQIDAALRAGDGPNAIARRFGVTGAAITLIKTGHNWRWLTGRTGKGD